MNSANAHPIVSTPDSGRSRAGRTRWAAIGAAIAIAVGAVGGGGFDHAAADVSSGDRPVFVPTTPCRLIDMRPGASNVGPRSTPMGTNETFTVTAHGPNGNCTGGSAIPNDAVALALNVTALGATEQTFLTFWGDGNNPGTANLNPAPGQPPTPNAVNTPLSSGGTFNIYNEKGSVNVVVDVNGYYAHHDHDDRYALPIDDIAVGWAAFSPQTTPSSWTRGFGFSHPIGVNECIAAPVTFPTGAVVSSVNLQYFAPSQASVELTLGGTRNSAGQGLTLPDLVHVVTQTSPTAPIAAMTAADEVGSIALPIGTDTTTRDDFAYVVTICTADEIVVLGTSIELA